jgi:DNA-binding transcriptional LysR family regulator
MQRRLRTAHGGKSGAGLLLQPEVLVAEELASGRLVRVLEDYTPEPRPVHLLWRQDLRPLPKLTQFIAHIMQALPVAVPA